MILNLTSCFLLLLGDSFWSPQVSRQRFWWFSLLMNWSGEAARPQGGLWFLTSLSSAMGRLWLTVILGLQRQPNWELWPHSFDLSLHSLLTGLHLFVSSSSPVGPDHILFSQYPLWFSTSSPHTGMQLYQDGVKRIPTACITIEDAELMWRMAQRRQRIVVRLNMEAKTLPDADSYNTVAEIRGWQHPEQVALSSTAPSNLSFLFRFWICQF